MIKNTSENVILSDNQFKKLMKDYAALSHSHRDEKFRLIGSDKVETHDLLKKYGFNKVFGREELATEIISETDVLQYIEAATGRNTFMYSKTAYIEATDAAVDRTVSSKYQTVKCLKEELRLREEAWHKETGCEDLGTRGRNLYKDNSHLKDVMKSGKLSNFTEQAKGFVDTFSAWDSKGYVAMIYNLAVMYDEHTRDKVKSEFGNRDDFNKPFKSRYVDVSKNHEDKLSTKTQQTVDSVLNKAENMDNLDSKNFSSALSK